MIKKKRNRAAFCFEMKVACFHIKNRPLLMQKWPNYDCETGHLFCKKRAYCNLLINHTSVCFLQLIFQQQYEPQGLFNF